MESQKELQKKLKSLSSDALANMLPSIIWVEGFPCELRITRCNTIYRIEYVGWFDEDELNEIESTEISSEGKELSTAIIAILMKILCMDECSMVTYEDEQVGKDGEKRKFELNLDL